MRNLRYYWAYLPASSSGEYAALGKLAERERFELAIRILRRTARQAAAQWLMSCALPIN
jgi:hypothetical protein